jgi:hypothetical protein
MKTMRIATIGLLALALAGVALAMASAQGTEVESGQVQIPLEIYQQLVEAAEQPTLAPTGFALGKADLNVQVAESEGHASAEVQVALTIEVLEDRWVLVPILPAGTPVSSVAIDGKPVQLINTPGGLAWGVNEKGGNSFEC